MAMHPIKHYRMRCLTSRTVPLSRSYAFLGIIQLCKMHLRHINGANSATYWLYVHSPNLKTWNAVGGPLRYHDLLATPSYLDVSQANSNKKRNWQAPNQTTVFLKSATSPFGWDLHCPFRMVFALPCRAVFWQEGVQVIAQKSL